MSLGAIHRRIRRLGCDQRGATAVEFALVIGPFLLLMFGVIEFGRMMWTLNALQETAIAGARCMGVRNTGCVSAGAYSSANTTTYVQGVASGWGLTLTGSQIALSNAATCAGVPGFSQATITYTFNTAVPMLTALVNDPLTATSCFPNQG